MAADACVLSSGLVVRACRGRSGNPSRSRTVHNGRLTVARLRFRAVQAFCVHGLERVTDDALEVFDRARTPVGRHAR